MRFVVRSPLLALGVLASYSAPAQYGAGRAQLPIPYPSAPYQLPRRLVVYPTISIDDAGSIQLEPDSATRHLYARHRVRTVCKLRLNKQGQVQDTVEYLTVDEQGRWMQAGPRRTQVHRQWSYNQAGQCTALIEHPRAARPYTVINTYNPALRRGHQEVLQRNGTRTLVQEKQFFQHGDTLLTEVRAHKLVVDNYAYPEYVQRSLRLTPHPDTLLSLTAFYDMRQQFSGYQLDYFFYHQGRLVERGKVHLPKARPADKATGAAVPAPIQALAALRQATGRQPQDRRFYNAQRHLIRQEITKGESGQLAGNVIRYTYNSLGQLIGREAAVALTKAAVYAVYSYLPTGLLAGETTDAHGTPVSYRYQYQYYD